MLNTDEIVRYSKEELCLPEKCIEFLSRDLVDKFSELFIISAMMQLADIYNHGYTGDRSDLHVFMQRCMAKIEYLKAMVKAEINRIDRSDMKECKKDDDNERS